MPRPVAPRLVAWFGALVLISAIPDRASAQAAIAPSTVLRRGALARRQQPANPRLLPDISVVGDFVADFSPDGSTQEDGSRIGVREVEVAFQAAVDPYFRGDVFLGFSDAEGVHIEQAFLTATALPYGLEARLGRFLMPFGKDNTSHRHDLHTIEHAYVIQRFLGEEGLKGTGLYLSKVFAPFGFYQELIATAGDGFPEEHHHEEEEEEAELAPLEPANDDLSGLLYSARLRNYWDFSEAANLEISASALTGKRPQPIDPPSLDPLVNAINARQSLAGVDVTFRWRPLQEGLYRSFILRGEMMWQFNEEDPEIPSELPPGTSYAGPVGDFSGAYVFARYQLTRRLFLEGRYDVLEDPELFDDTFTAGSGYLEWFPSEFSKLVAGVERVASAGGVDGFTRVLLQATFALGPHRPHPF